MKAFQDFLKRHEFFAGATVGLALALVAAAFWTRDQAQKAVLDPNFVSDLSKTIRPFMVTDSKRRILSDYGAARELDDFKIEFSTNKVDIKVTLEFKSHRQNPPIVRPMSPGLYLDRFERGTKHSWIFWVRTAFRTTVEYNTAVMITEDLNVEKDYSFMIELLP